MPRPSPLQNVVTGRPQTSDYQSLTPRTPHSRAGRAEEALDGVELEVLGDEDYRTYRQEQSEPLLASSSSSSFPPSGLRSRGDDHDITSPRRGGGIRMSLELIVHRLPLAFGATMACLLLFLVVLSLKRPDVLQYYVGDTNATSQPNTAFIADLDAQSTPTFVPPPSIPTTSQPQDPNMISYENYTKFPLLPTDYRAECNKLNSGFMSHGRYWEAPRHGPYDVFHNAASDYTMFEGEPTRVCNSTITYMLDGHVGLLADLALMSQAAAMAREQNRTFLLDDSYWNRGKWTDHFQDVRSRQPGPEPGCRAPPPEELVACPRTARHWVINSRTAKFHFGHPFSEEYEDPYSIGLNRLKPIFNSALDSLTNTIRPNAHNAALIRSTRAEFAASYPSPYISVHLRRGDRVAVSWDYHGKHVPITKYSDAVQHTFTRLFPQASSETSRMPAARTVYIASDSPPAREELISSIPSTTSIFSLAASTNPDLQSLASPKEYVQDEFNALDENERVKLTRGMVVDFAMTSGMWAWEGDVVPDATVCTITSSVCRLSAVALGWDRAFGQVEEAGLVDEQGKGWVEIDNRDMVTPVWQAFELFY